MGERYEIKGKIGQGGLGAVYRAHDVRMNREVAIKRILSNPDDSSISEEATKHLMQEAGSLASLQHPNIVTIHDVGTDADGPFVVMELLTGESLEELIRKGSLTWMDFRQLAKQTLEALIAAQELHIVHRDLKPGNIMLTWLPSGKFQVKIVDFGLAKLSAKPSLQTIDQSDGVFGSIYFMAPEQFERVPIDHRADIYAIGCVFYYVLTGTYPFDGETAAEVMASHLQHHVIPIQEVREGIPLWACDWIMWHINRQPSDRPRSALEALKLFIENDGYSSPPLSSGSPAPATEAPKRPRLVIPGAAPVPEVASESAPTQRVKTAAAPVALTPPDGSKTSVHSTSPSFQSEPGPEAPYSAQEVPQTLPDSSQPFQESNNSIGEGNENDVPQRDTEAHAPASDAQRRPRLVIPGTASVSQVGEEQVRTNLSEAAITPRAVSPTTGTTTNVPAASQVIPSEPITEVQVPAGQTPQTRPPAEGASQIPSLKRSQPAIGGTPPLLRRSGAATAPVLISNVASAQISETEKTIQGSGSLPSPHSTASPGTKSQPASEISKPSPIPSKSRVPLSPAIKVMIATLLGIFVVIAAVFALKKSGDNAEAKEYNEMIQTVKDENSTELLINNRKLEILLRSASSVGESSKEIRDAVNRALVLAKSTDGTDVDARIAEFATTQVLIPNVRKVIIRDVLRQRNNPAIVGTLLNFARSTDDIPAAVAAIEATRFMATEAHFQEFLEIIGNTKQNLVRKAAEENAAEIIQKSSSKPALGQAVSDRYNAATSDDVRHAFLRLLGRTGGDAALALVKQSLHSDDIKQKIAAIVSLGNWVDDSGFKALIEFLATGPDLQLRTRAYDAAYQYVISSPDASTSEEVWALLGSESKTQNEQLKLARGLANVDPAPWAFKMLKTLTAESNEYGKVVDLAERAIVRLKDIEKTRAPKKAE